jgi:MFS family permease
MFIRLFHGLSTGFKPTATSAYIADIVSPQERGVSMGILGVFTSSGMAIGPMVGPWISANWGINSLFYISSFISFLSVAVIFGMKETLSNKERLRVNHLRITPADFFEKNVLPVAITFLLTVIPFGIILTLIPDFSDSLGIENRGVFFSIYVGASLAIRLIAGKVSDKHGRVPVLIVASFTLGVSMIMLALTQTTFLFYASALLFGLASGMNSPTIFAWNIDRSHPEHRGRGMATLYMFLEFGIGAGALLGGFTFNNNLNNLPYAFGLGATTAFLATAYLIWFRAKKALR